MSNRTVEEIVEYIEEWRKASIRWQSIYKIEGDTAGYNHELGSEDTCNTILEFIKGEDHEHKS